MKYYTKEQEELIEKVAELLYNANKIYCESHNDFSLKDWNETADNIKRSAIDGVKYHIENPDVTPEDSHNNWLKFKTDDGWVYGPIKDEAKKEHPCMVPYKELPEMQQYKDRIFGTICNLFTPMINK